MALIFNMEKQAMKRLLILALIAGLTFTPAASSSASLTEASVAQAAKVPSGRISGFSLPLSDGEARSEIEPVIAWEPFFLWAFGEFLKWLFTSGTAREIVCRATAKLGEHYEAETKKSAARVVFGLSQLLGCGQPTL